MLRTPRVRRAHILAAVAALVVALLPASPVQAQTGWSITGVDAADLGPHVPAIAVAPAGEVAVVDASDSTVKAFTNDGAFLRTWGGLGIGDGRFIRPAAVAYTAAGDVLVGDAARVQRFGPAGNLLASFGSSGTAPGQLREVGGLAVTAAGDVLVSDRMNDRVQRFTAAGTPAGVWVAGQVEDPRGIAVSPDGSVYVADLGHERVLRLSAAGEPLGSWHVEDPHGVAVGPDGRVYVADTDRHRVLAFAPTGAPAGQVGGHLVLPEGVATDCRGRVFVSDNSTSRLQRFGTDAPSPPCVAPPQPPPPPPPVPAQKAVLGATATSEMPRLGLTLVASRVSGKVLVRPRGSRSSRRLSKDREVFPIGSRFDTTDGRVKLELATAPADQAVLGPVQEGEFYDGVFTVFQSKTATLTEVTLAGEPLSCGARALTAATRKKRRVWGSARGQFRTSGSNGAASVRGTIWLTEDRCDGTLVKVNRGTVGVDDFSGGKTHTVNAGEEYLAQAPCRSKRAFTITLRTPVGQRLRTVTVLVNGRRAPVHLGLPTTADIDLRGLPKGEVVVKITAVTATGVRLTGERRYRTCADKGPPRNGSEGLK